MSERLRVTFLGTGTSHGVPMIACDCAVCTSDDPRDRRYRTALAVTAPDARTLLIDCPPELRLAAIEHKLARVDAVCITHAHADHIMGADDLRRYNNVRDDTLEVFAAADALAVFTSVFGYAVRDYVNADRPSFTPREITGEFTAAGMRITPVPIFHGRLPILGYRIGRMAYLTDCSAIPDESMPLLEGLEVLILDALRHTPHPAHMNLEQALAAAGRIGARRTFLTHIAHEIKHATVAAELPDGVELAYDGLVLEATV